MPIKVYHSVIVPQIWNVSENSSVLAWEQPKPYSGTPGRSQDLSSKTSESHNHGRKGYVKKCFLLPFKHGAVLKTPPFCHVLMNQQRFLDRTASPAEEMPLDNALKGELNAAFPSFAPSVSHVLWRVLAPAGGRKPHSCCVAHEAFMPRGGPCEWNLSRSDTGSTGDAERKCASLSARLNKVTLWF